MSDKGDIEKTKVLMDARVHETEATR